MFSTGCHFYEFSLSWKRISSLHVFLSFCSPAPRQVSTWSSVCCVILLSILSIFVWGRKMAVWPKNCDSNRIEPNLTLLVFGLLHIFTVTALSYFLFQQIQDIDFEICRLQPDGVDPCTLLLRVQIPKIIFFNQAEGKKKILSKKIFFQKCFY